MKCIVKRFETVNEIIMNPKMFQNYYKKIFEIYDNLPYKFRPRLRYLRESLGYTREQLEDRSYVSAQTIKQIETNDERGYSIETVVALCIGMQLPPDLSFELIKSSGYNIENNDSKKIFLYCYILRYLYNDGIDFINEFLKENNELPLGDNYR